MSDGTVKELKRRDSNNHWSVKLFVVNGEEQWWVENGERNIALCMSRSDAEHIAEAHNKFRGMSSILDKSVAETLAVIEAVHTAYKENGIPFSGFWEAIKKQAEKEKSDCANRNEESEEIV